MTRIPKPLARRPTAYPMRPAQTMPSTRPATTSHSGMSPADRKKLGISDSLIRISVGLEATEDLIEDFDQALAA